MGNLYNGLWPKSPAYKLGHKTKTNKPIAHSHTRVALYDSLMLEERRPRDQLGFRRLVKLVRPDVRRLPDPPAEGVASVLLPDDMDFLMGFHWPGRAPVDGDAQDTSLAFMARLAHGHLQMLLRPVQARLAHCDHFAYGSDELFLAVHCQYTAFV